jgi:uncharacterized membrane protein YebE (DUF533 family)
MKRIALSASVLALLSGIVLAAPAQAASLTAHERAVLARSHAHVRALEHHARADGHVSLWEKAKIGIAKSRQHALAWRLRRN